MPGISDNVIVGRSGGSKCFVCETQIPSGTISLRVTFDIDVFIQMLKVSKEMHLGCARELRDILDVRIREAARRHRVE